MNSLTDPIVDEAKPSDEQPQAGEPVGADSANVAFAGDTGVLSVDTRRVLVQLLLGPSVDARRQSKLWPVLLRDEAIVRSRLHDLFLELVMDHEQRVAFTRQVVSNELDVPILLRKASLTFIESALLLYLRQRLTQADAQGERAAISVAEMSEHLAVFERNDNSNHAAFERKIVNAIDKAKKLSLLQKIRGGEERYEVAPTLKLLFSAEEIQTLTKNYMAMASAGAVAGDDDEDPADETPTADDSEEQA